jgi:nicotinate phosphoribosyltransferase
MKHRSTAEGILFTDQYQLTMAQLYFRLGLHEQQAQFDHFFRRYPDYGAHRAGYCVNAGLDWLLDWMGTARFGAAEIELMGGMLSRTGRRLFSEDFLAWLRSSGNFGGISLQSIPEGRVVHAHVPLTVVRGPLAMAQILETPLLNILNYQTLIATKAARLRESAGDALVLEFGLRRAHGRGGNAGTRAALIGGANFSSNAGISHLLGYPPKGTHAHSMVQAFLALGMTELDAFQAYADTYPDECLFLVDTIDTLESGVPNAIRVFERLRKRGYSPVGVRLDSGDLAYLSVQTATMLDDAGFSDAAIVLSNDLDEINILQIKSEIGQEAARHGLDGDRIVDRLVYGVGTRLITSAGDSALGGVYKLVALENDSGWQPVLKLSEDPVKTPMPGGKRVWRIYDERCGARADLLTLGDENPARQWQMSAQSGVSHAPSAQSVLTLRHPWERAKSRAMAADQISSIEPLLVDVLVDGQLVGERVSIEQIRAARCADVERLDAGVRQLIEPQSYHVSVSERLWALRERLLGSLSGGRVDQES